MGPAAVPHHQPNGHLSGEVECGTLELMPNEQPVIVQGEESGAETRLRPRRMLAPSEVAEHDRRRQRLVLLSIRTLFLVLLVTVSLLPFVGALTEDRSQEFSVWNFALPFL